MTERTQKKVLVAAFLLIMPFLIWIAAQVAHSVGYWMGTN